MGIVALVKFIGPATIGVINAMDPALVEFSAVFIALVMIIDTIYSVKHIDSEKLWFVDKQEEFIENNKIMNIIRNTFKK